MNRRTFLLGSSLALATTGLGYAWWESRWNYIVIHHSAGNYGTIPFLQKVHRERQAGDPIDAIPYHFVVGNGNGIGDGEVVSDWRFEYRLWGAHVSARNPDRNFRGLGVCLIGNFQERAPSQKQYASAVSLVQSLIKKYNIPLDNVSGHGLTKGESTLCPGKHFPFDQFKKDIAKKTDAAV